MLRWVSFETSSRTAAWCHACSLRSSDGITANAAVELLVDPRLVRATAHGQRGDQRPAHVLGDLEALEHDRAVQQSAHERERLFAAPGAAVRRRRDPLAERAGQRLHERELVVAAGFRTADELEQALLPRRP